MKNILFFSDVHGRIPLMIKMVWQFQKENDVKIDLVVITGDLGVWPDGQKLDSSTRNYILKKEEYSELGFQCFEPIVPYSNTPIKNWLPEEATRHRNRELQLLRSILKEVTCHFLFVGGNHEDYDYLNLCYEKGRMENSALIPVEKSLRFQWLVPGTPYSFHGLSFAGISGIDAAESGRNPNRYHPAIRIDDNKVLDVLISLEEIEIHIFLSHDGLPDSARKGQGSELLKNLIEGVVPKYHFFGHFHREIEPFLYAKRYPGFSSKTIGVHINKLSFSNKGDIKSNVMYHMVLSENMQMKGKFVSETWLSSLRNDNWYHLPISLL